MDRFIFRCKLLLCNNKCYATCSCLYANITRSWKSPSIDHKYKVTLECKISAKMFYTQWCNQTQLVGRVQPDVLITSIEYLTVILLEYLNIFNVSVSS